MNSRDTRIKVLKNTLISLKNNIIDRAHKDTTVHYNRLFKKSMIIIIT